jgi:hypothetical protein
MNYALIEEAWGDISGRKKKKSKTQDPICELYSYKNRQIADNTLNYNSELDLVNNSNASFAKNKYQRNMGPLTDGEDVRESTIKNVMIDQDKKYYDVSDKMPQSLFEKQFEIPFVKQEDSCNYYDEIDNQQDQLNTMTDDEDIEEYVYKRQPRQPQQRRKPNYYEEYLDEFGYQNRKPKLLYLDILLYIISGIILIFLLEQFVQIGKTMAHL